MGSSPVPTQIPRGKVPYVSRECRLSEVAMCHLCAYMGLHNPESVIGSCCSPLDCVHIRHLLQGAEPGFEVQWEHTLSVNIVHSPLSLPGEFGHCRVKMAHMSPCWNGFKFSFILNRLDATHIYLNWNFHTWWHFSSRFFAGHFNISSAEL